ncbi:MAG: ATP-binding protein, partial [Phycicoccus sp.]
MTRAQLLDVRSRVVAELDAAPTLLVLDHCEHVLDAVAELVGSLLVATRDLRVLTTSRAPLGLAAEQAVALSQLDPVDAGALFVARARAARADVLLDPGPVADIVDRLDGLPLAVELAAARVRTMTVEEVRGGLADRFALLRSRHRTAPERHRTLEAVIEWSWDLLEPPAREALARLSMLPGGVTRRTAGVLLGTGGPDLVETLAEQSLVVVSETCGAMRFRMLETVREFGLARIEALALADDARERVDTWAADLVAQHAPGLLGPHEFAAVDALREEDANLTDVVHRALRRGDPAVVVRVLSGLAMAWGITGDNARLFAVADTVEQVLAGWEPPPQLRERALEVVGWLLVHVSWLPGHDVARLHAMLATLGTPHGLFGRIAYVTFVEAPRSGTPVVDALLALSDADDPRLAPLAHMWAALVAENAAETDRARAAALHGLELDPDSPYVRAALQAQLAQLDLAEGSYAQAARHAEAAWPALARLQARDDAQSLRFIAATALLLQGRHDEAERRVDEVAAEGVSGPSARLTLLAARAELALARDRTAEALALFDDAVLAVAD